MRRFLLLLVVALQTNVSALYATHIIGGELSYQCLGNDQYLITLKVYRDCYLGEAPFDNPANVSVWTPSGQLIMNISMAFPGSTNVPFVATNPCFQSPPNVCVEEAIYKRTVTLPPSTTGYILAYQRCCRNNTILNLVSPQTTGATYTETIPPSSQISCNSSPEFINFPPIAICIGDTLVFNHSAIDPDGDSLVYRLCTTYSGADPINPQPVPTSAPPFQNIVFANPYNQNYPIATNPPVSIDPFTGILRVSPTQIGQYVVGVCAEEYRNGVLIGTHSRDFQFNVTMCLSNTVADFSLPPDFIQGNDGVLYRCGEYKVDFINNSVNANQYLWDFGVTNITTDTSGLLNPSYIFPDSGYYMVALIANPGYFCADTAYLPVRIKPLLDINITPLPGQCIDNNLFSFNISGFFGTNIIYNWVFQNGNPPVSQQANPQVTYASAGTFPVVLYAEERGCYDTAQTSVTVYGHPIPDILIPPTGCAPFTITFQNNTDAQGNQLVYNWVLGNGQTSSAPSPTVTYPNPGTYNLTLQISSTTGCMDQFNYSWPLDIFPSPHAQFVVDPLVASIFSPEFQFVDQSWGGISCWLYFDNGDSTDQCTIFYEYPDTGHYTPYQVVINEYGCPDTAFQKIWVKPEFTYFVPNAFTVNGDGINDTFRGYGIGIKEIDFRIYDRWGHVIFQTNDQTESWNGRHRNVGADIPNDIYVWAADVTDVFGRYHQLRGKVLLLRSMSNH